MYIIKGILVRCVDRVGCITSRCLSYQARRLGYITQAKQCETTQWIKTLQSYSEYIRVLLTFQIRKRDGLKFHLCVLR